MFNDASTLTGIVNDIDFLLNTDSTSFPLTHKARLTNHWYDRVVSLIMQSDRRWEWSDSNNTTLDIATTSLVANQQDYGIDASVHYRILRIEALDNSGNGIQLKPLSQEDKRGTAMTEFLKTASTPEYYDLMGNSVFLYPKPSYGKALGLKIYFQRGASYFVSTDTTKTPGFNPMFHRILSYGASYDFCLANGLMNKIALFKTEIAELENSLVTFYSMRHRDEKLTMRLQVEDYGSESSFDDSANFPNS